MTPEKIAELRGLSDAVQNAEETFAARGAAMSHGAPKVFEALPELLDLAEEALRLRERVVVLEAAMREARDAVLSVAAEKWRYGGDLKLIEDYDAALKGSVR